MIESLRQWLLSLCAAALLCALVCALAPQGCMRGLCRVLAGLFLAVAALRAPLGWEEADFAQALSRARLAAEQARTGVEIQSRAALCEIIKDKTEAYIWDKATELGCAVQVAVTLDEQAAYPYPAAVRLTGRFSAQARAVLTAYIEENLAIGKERQTWTSE